MNKKFEFKEDDKKIIKTLQVESKRLVDEIMEEPFRLLNLALEKVRIKNDDGSYVMEDNRIQEDWSKLSPVDIEEMMFKLAAFNLTLTSRYIDSIIEHKYAKIVSDDVYAHNLLGSGGSAAEDRKAEAILLNDSRYLLLFKECFKIRFEKMIDAFDRMYASCSRIATLRINEMEKLR